MRGVTRGGSAGVYRNRYGAPPAGLTQHIQSCMQRLELLQLTDDAVDKLYKRDLSNMLF